jgi:hypothetical protein
MSENDTELSTEYHTLHSVALTPGSYQFTTEGDDQGALPKIDRVSGIVIDTERVEG